jgi:hypothetical protein
MKASLTIAICFAWNFLCGQDSLVVGKKVNDISIGNERVFKNIGTGITWRLQDNYYWQSFLVNGNVPANAAIDAQLGYLFSKSAFRLKIAARNLLNHYYTSFLGGPRIGGFYYTTITYGLN